MKITLTFLFSLLFQQTFAQWTRVQELPSTDISSLYVSDSTLYAGGGGLLYFSTNNGQSWELSGRLPVNVLVDNIIKYKNDLFVSSYATGAFRSIDGGRNWTNITNGIIPFISDFTEFRGMLFASTLGGAVFVLDPLTRDRWTTFSNGLSSLSQNLNAIGHNGHVMIAGTIANGIYDHLPENSGLWEERTLRGQISPTEQIYDIINAHDTLFVSASTGFSYMSTDNGLNWVHAGDRLTTVYATYVNAKQAIILCRGTFTGVNNTEFFYIKKDSLGFPFQSFSFVPDHFNYKTVTYGGKLWDASNRGLFSMPLSDLPGITAANDTMQPVILPVHFIYFNINCDENTSQLDWKTGSEINSNRFNIEKSNDGHQWTVIGTIPAAGTSTSEHSYSFKDNNSPDSSFYRIAEFDLDGRVQYSSTIRSFCKVSNIFKYWPNPTHSVIHLSINTDKQSRAIIKLYDSKGSLVKVLENNLLQGNNLVTMEIGELANGYYSLQLDWNGGQNHKTATLIKQ